MMFPKLDMLKFQKISVFNFGDVLYYTKKGAIT